MYFKVTIEAGLNRAADSFNIVRYIEAENTVVLFDELEKMPGLSSKELGYEITMVKPVSEKEFLKRKVDEEKNPHLLRIHVRFDVSERCKITPIQPDEENSKPFDAKTIDLSAGGFGIKYSGEKLEEGSLVKVTIEKLKIINKEARVRWNGGGSDEFRSGLEWLGKA